MSGGDGMQTYQIWNLVGGLTKGDPPVPVGCWSAGPQVSGKALPAILQLRKERRQVARRPLAAAVPISPGKIIVWGAGRDPLKGGHGPELSGAAE